MSYSEYTQQVEEQSSSIRIDEAFDVVPAEQWELSDFADILQSV